MHHMHPARLHHPTDASHAPCTPAPLTPRPAPQAATPFMHARALCRHTCRPDALTAAAPHPHALHMRAPQLSSMQAGKGACQLHEAHLSHWPAQLLLRVVRSKALVAPARSTRQRHTTAAPGEVRKLLVKCASSWRGAQGSEHAHGASAMQRGAGCARSYRAPQRGVSCRAMAMQHGAGLMCDQRGRSAGVYTSETKPTALGRPKRDTQARPPNPLLLHACYWTGTDWCKGQMAGVGARIRWHGLVQGSDGTGWRELGACQQQPTASSKWGGARLRPSAFLSSCPSHPSRPSRLSHLSTLSSFSSPSISSCLTRFSRPLSTFSHPRPCPANARTNARRLHMLAHSLPALACKASDEV